MLGTFFNVQNSIAFQAIASQVPLLGPGIAAIGVALQ